MTDPVKGWVGRSKTAPLQYQIPEASARGREPAGAIEFCQSRLVVDVQPFDSAAAGLARAGFDELSADAFALSIRGDRGIEEKPVHAAVADDLGKTDEPFSFVSTDINQGLAQGRSLAAPFP